jgi:hypothetical protein
MLCNENTNTAIFREGIVRSSRKEETAPRETTSLENLPKLGIYTDQL